MNVRTVTAAAAFAWMLAGCAATAPVTPPTAQPAGQPAPSAGNAAGNAAEHAAGSAALDPDTVRAGRFDNGKMWTFEAPPLDYIEETYGFRPDAAWLERARLGALRIPGCTASFVSPNGLIATNHHCARSGIVAVAREGEDLLADGFTARSLDEERPIPGFFAEQLVAIDDVTAEVEGALAGVAGDAARAEARQAAARAIAARLAADRGGADAGYTVQVVSLYHGGRYSAYTFRRYTDVRLVAAPEEQLGYFGGDYDNFTYPRYSLDFALLRAYDADGRPLQTPHHFALNPEGVSEGDAVFVIGNPGSTNRLETTAQLAWRRDVQVPGGLAYLESRMAALAAYMAEAPDNASARNTYFSLSNAQKAYAGRLAALRDPYLMARRRDAERQFAAALAADPALQAEYGGLIDEMAALQAQKMAQGAAFRGLRQLLVANTSSATLARAVRAYRLQQGQGDRAALTAELRAVHDRTPGLERRLLAAQLDEIRRFFDEAGQPVPAAVAGGTPLEAADRLLAASALATADRAGQALDAGSVPAGDPALQVLAAVMPAYDALDEAFRTWSAREAEIASRLGRARYDVYGTAVPPDATFSLRFTDGVVRPYAYNGTLAPTHTTFHGLYDHYYSYGAGTDWDLPERWLAAPATFDRSVPLNFISTADTIGGNSGSPAVDRDLRLVGLNFDRTIEGLSRDYIYLPDRGRNVMVDARAVLEALDEVYDLDRAALELTTGRLYPTEAEADAAP